MKKICDAGQAELLRKRSSVSAVYDGPARAARCRSRDRPSTPFDRQGRHGEPVIRRRDRLLGRCGGMRDGQHDDAIERERLPRGQRRVEMPEVDRIERSAEHADARGRGSFSHGVDRARAAAARSRAAATSRHIASRSGVSAFPGRRRRQRRAERPGACRCSSSRASRSGSSSASILFAATMIGFSASRSPEASRPGNSSSSRVIIVEVARPDRGRSATTRRRGEPAPSCVRDG